jgi:glycosyltransferase involved in cell wall biosynthesis
MSVHDGERYLNEAVASVLRQTLSDFEFLIVDDASNDGSASLVESFGDPRIRLLRNPENLGLAASLNRGIDLARGVYIARMDSDDVSLPERLAAQAAFLDARPRVSVCGSWVEFIGERAGHVWRYPTDPDAIRCRLLFESPLAHPSVMIRKAHLDEAGFRYDPAFRRAQDYDLWVRATPRLTLANVPEVLMQYRIHPGQAGERNFEEQQEFAGRVRRAQLERLGIPPTPEEFSIHQALSTGRVSTDREFVEGARAWLAKIQAANEDRGHYPEPGFSRYLGERWFALCRKATRWGWWTWRQYRDAPVGRRGDPTFGKKIKFALRCAVRWNGRARNAAT